MIRSFFSSPILDVVYAGNTVAQYLDVVLYFVIAVGIFFAVQYVLLAQWQKFAERTKADVDDVTVAFVRSIRPQLYVVFAIFFALHTLTLSDFIRNAIDAVVILIVIFQITRSLQIIVEFFARRFSHDGDDPHTKNAAHILGSITIFIVWLFGILMILSNVGVNVTSLIAGVGIGGIAIAFAVRELLSDLFSSFAIYFDRPFRVGDVIRVGKDTGTVQKIGIKTTRIRSVSGEEIIVSNQSLTSASVHNFKKLSNRVVTFRFGIDYAASNDAINTLLVRTTQMIDAMDNAHCKRAHFKSFGAYALECEVVYVVETRSYGVYMDLQQAINFGIRDIAADLGVRIVHRVSCGDEATE